MSTRVVIRPFNVCNGCPDFPIPWHFIIWTRNGCKPSISSTNCAIDASVLWLRALKYSGAYSSHVQGSEDLDMVPQTHFPPIAHTIVNYHRDIAIICEMVKLLAFARVVALATSVLSTLR